MSDKRKDISYTFFCEATWGLERPQARDSFLVLNYSTLLDDYQVEDNDFKLFVYLFFFLKGSFSE